MDASGGTRVAPNTAAGIAGSAALAKLNGGDREMKVVNALLNDEQGASMAEYAMLLALIAVATIGAVTALRDQIIAVFNSSASTLGSAS